MTAIFHDAPVCFTCRDRYGISTYKVVGISNCSICATRQTPCYFADADQQIDWTLYQMADVEYTRASGDAICRKCNKTYRKHPVDRRPEARAYDGQSFLHVLCDGKRVKL